MTVLVIGQFRIPAEHLEQAKSMMAGVMQKSRAEPGCLEYNYAEDLLDPGLIRVSEVWESHTQLAAHLQSAHMGLWRNERTMLGMTGRAIKMFTATDEGTAF